ncbi:MAG: GNAT family N-acetyltransferase [Myxococcota bacterium]
MEVNLQEITPANLAPVLRCRVAEGQERFVAPNAESLAEAFVNPRLVPRAIYDGAMRGRNATRDDPVRGFVMYQVWDEIGFVKRLMVGADDQGRGYGRAAMHEVLRRLERTPEVRRIATSYHHEAVGAKALYTSLGFTRVLEVRGVETYVALDWDPLTEWR